MVLVSGALLVSWQTLLSRSKRAKLTQSKVDEEQKPMSYTQVFQLLPDGQGSYYVFNDIFRLVYLG
jgi:hypothetical protein